MEYNYRDFVRVSCRKRLRVQCNNRRVRASTPLVSRGTRWDPRIFECSRPRINARVPPHPVRPFPSAALASRYFRLFHARYGAQIKAEKVIWQSDVCIVAWQVLVRQSPLTIVLFFLQAFNTPRSVFLRSKRFSLNNFSQLI